MGGSSSQAKGRSLYDRSKESKPPLREGVDHDDVAAEAVGVLQEGVFVGGDNTGFQGVAELSLARAAGIKSFSAGGEAEFLFQRLGFDGFGEGGFELAHHSGFVFGQV